MARRWRSVLVSVVSAGLAAATLALAGCGAPRPASPSGPLSAVPSTPVPAPDPALGWTDAMCGSLTQFVSSVSKTPTPSPADPAAAVVRVHDEVFGGDHRATGADIVAALGYLSRYERKWNKC